MVGWNKCFTNKKADFRKKHIKLNITEIFIVLFISIFAGRAEPL